MPGINYHRFIFHLGVIFLFLFSPQTMANDGNANSDAMNLVNSSCDVCSPSQDVDAAGLPEEVAASLMDDAAMTAAAMTVQYLADPVNAPDVAIPSSQPSRPATPRGPTSGEINKLLTFSTVASNPGGERIKYVFEWRENYASTFSETSYVSPNVAIETRHAWHSCGRSNGFSVRVKAVDEQGTSSEWSYFRPVQIYSIPQTPNRPHGPNCARVNALCTFSTSTPDSCSKIKYIFDWGDGSRYHTGYYNSLETASVSHRWSRPGNYDIRVTAINEFEKMSGWSAIKRICVRSKGECPG